MSTLEQQQYDVEVQSDSEAKAKRLAEYIKEAKEGNPNLPRAQALIGRLCIDVTDNINSICSGEKKVQGAKQLPWLRKLSPEVAAAIAIRECVIMCSNQSRAVKLQNLSYNIGVLYELEIRTRQAEIVNPLYMAKIHDKINRHATKNARHIRGALNAAIAAVFKEHNTARLPQTEIIRLGMFGVSACYDAGLLSMSKYYSAKKKRTIVQYNLHPDVLDFVTNYKEGDVLFTTARTTQYMICEPRPWTNLENGGYLSPSRVLAAPLLSTRGMSPEVQSRIRRVLTPKNAPEVYEVANYLQSVPFEIHRPTMRAITSIWQSGGGVLGIPRTTQQEPPVCPLEASWRLESSSEEERDAFFIWKRDCRMYYEGLRKWKSKVLECRELVLGMGRQDTKHWLPVFIDSRGRWYYRGVITPQGSDIAKGALHFHDKKPLGERGIYWLKVHIANSYGYDSTRFDDRARWTEQHWDSIERALDAPEDYPDVWGEKMWCMFSAAWELREAYKLSDPTQYCTGIPVHMDATCSGLQHLSAIAGDEIGGKYVNLTDSGGFSKEDIYAKVAEAALEAVNADVDDPEVGEYAKWWLDKGIPRALAKKPVMTYVYGATLGGTADYIENYLIENNMLETNTGFTYVPCMYLAKKIFLGVEKAVPKAVEVMKWLQNSVTNRYTTGPMWWKTPSGFLVSHEYYKVSDHSITIKCCGLKRIRSGKLSKNLHNFRMKNAVSPNFTHSMDASHVALVSMRMKEAGRSLVGVHDSFGTHPCDIDDLHVVVREEFVRMYKDGSVLREYRDSVGATEDIPSRGNLDIYSVLTSEFMFC